MRHYPLLLLFIILISCDSDRVTEENWDLSDGNWIVDDTKKFEFEITDRNIPYQVFFNVRNGLSYKYHNIYVKYILSNEKGEEVQSNLVNFDLFNPKSGKPNGSGIGDIFDHQMTLISNYDFPEPGHYNLELKHYMRTDTLQQIFSVGIRIESKQDEGN